MKQNTISNVLEQGVVIPQDVSAVAVQVAPYSLLRIECAAPTYLVLRDTEAEATVPTSTTSPAIKLPIGISLVNATKLWIRASANPVRIEVIPR